MQYNASKRHSAGFKQDFASEKTRRKLLFPSRPCKTFFTSVIETGLGQEKRSSWIVRLSTRADMSSASSCDWRPLLRNVNLRNVVLDRTMVAMRDPALVVAKSGSWGMRRSSRPSSWIVLLTPKADMSICRPDNGMFVFRIVRLRNPTLPRR